jgi:hypothetical protein
LIEYSALVAGSFAKSDRELLAISGVTAGQFSEPHQQIRTFPEAWIGILPRAAFAGHEIW